MFFWEPDFARSVHSTMKNTTTMCTFSEVLNPYFSGVRYSLWKNHIGNAGATALADALNHSSTIASLE